MGKKVVRSLVILSVVALLTIVGFGLIAEMIPPSEGLVLHFPSN